MTNQQTVSFRFNFFQLDNSSLSVHFLKLSAKARTPTFDPAYEEQVVSTLTHTHVRSAAKHKREQLNEGCHLPFPSGECANKSAKQPQLEWPPLGLARYGWLQTRVLLPSLHPCAVGVGTFKTLNLCWLWHRQHCFQQLTPHQLAGHPCLHVKRA